MLLTLHVMKFIIAFLVHYNREASLSPVFSFLFFFSFLFYFF